MNKQTEQALRELVHEMTGGETTSFMEAIEQWQQERQAMSELYYENERLVKLGAKTKLVIAQAIATIKKIELDANMFITPHTRAQVTKFRTMCKNLADGRDLTEIRSDEQ